MAGTVTSFRHTNVRGGLVDSYRVVAATDRVGRCHANVASGCAHATVTCRCTLAPQFAGATLVSSSADRT